MIDKCPKCGASNWYISLVIDGKRKDIEYPYYKCRSVDCGWEESKKEAGKKKIVGLK